jgi:Holliday junction resolvase RusA-like endonuclease
VLKLVILGAPVTKKTSQQIIRNKAGRSFIIPAARTRSWQKSAAIKILEQTRYVFTVPVNCRAMIYRVRQVGDAVNYYQAIADALEEAGVVVNDRLIVSWDGSRMLHDKFNPRVEIELRPAFGDFP